jgi:hypothetical protein
MDKPNQKKNLNSEDLKKYLSGSVANRHEIEKKLLDDSFSSDALDGFEKIKSDNIDEKIVLSDLKKRLNNRVLTKKRNPIFTWKSMSIAASLILVLGVSLFTLFFKKENEIAAITLPKEILDTTSKQINQDLAPVIPPQQNNVVSIKTNEPFDIQVLESKELANISAVYSPAPISVEILLDSITPNPVLAKSDVETVTISGQILDSENNPIPGVNISLKKHATTVTDSNGVFKVNHAEKDDLIQISAIGYQTKELKVSENDLGKIKLEEDTGALSEVIVTTKYPDNKKPMPTQSLLSQEPKPQMGWDNFDNYLLNSVKQTGAVSTLNLNGSIKFRAIIEPSGAITNVKLEENNLSKEQTEKIAKTIENNSRWIPAKKKGKNIRKEIKREIKIKN